MTGQLFVFCIGVINYQITAVCFLKIKTIKFNTESVSSVSSSGSCLNAFSITTVRQ